MASGAAATAGAGAGAASLASRFAAFAASGPRIVLGTASSSRRAIMDELAQQYSFSYEVLKADIDEKAIRCEQPQALVLALAHAKADALLQQLQLQQQQQLQQPGGHGCSGSASSSSGFLITCDQVVVHEGAIREKPADVAEAHSFIHSYARSPARTVGSVLATRLADNARHEEVEVCTIHMADMPDDVIDALIAEGDVMWCAGGLMIEHPAVSPYITQLEGSQDSVMGLGKDAVMRVLLRAAGML